MDNGDMEQNRNKSHTSVNAIRGEFVSWDHPRMDLVDMGQAAWRKGEEESKSAFCFEPLNGEICTVEEIDT